MVNFKFTIGIFWFAIVTVVIKLVSTNVYYVTTNSSGVSNSNTLKYYLDNPKRYFTSHSQLRFSPGDHQLDVDVVFEDIRNFTMTAISSCKIYCSPNVSIVVVNVTEFKLQNINLVNCGKNHTAFIQLKNFTDSDNSVLSNKTNHLHYNYNSSILLYHCALVQITSVNISVSAYSGGILAVNIKETFVLDNVKVQLECLDNSKFDHQIHGILLQYRNRGGKKANVTLTNFSYKVNGSCIHSSRYAMKVLLAQNKYDVSVTVKDTKFHNLDYSGVLYYHMLTCKLKAVNSIYIKNSTIINNTGDSTHTVFYIKLYKPECSNRIDFKDGATKQYNNFLFLNCKFVNNTNTKEMIYIIPASTSAYAGTITIQNSQFSKNKNIHFIAVKDETEIVPWQLSIFIHLHRTNVSLNEHDHGSNLISITNSVLYLKENSTFTNNGFYENILMLHLSTVICSEHSVIANNCVRQIMTATSGSYFIMTVNSTLSIMNNTVYIIANKVHTYKEATGPVCPIQFYNPSQVYDDRPDKIDVHIYLLYNVHTMSKGLIGNDLTFSNCTWLTGSAFRLIDAALVYKMVFQINHTVVNSNSTRRIPLSVCPCFNSNSYCYSPNLNSIYPGQTLHVSLIVRMEHIKKQNSPTTLVVANTPATDDCSITDSYQLTQTHLSQGCNNYSYTIWPSHKDITECKLFVGLVEMPEMFFVQIKHCPRGFTLQPSKQSCDCDPALNNIYFSITSCNLDDETISRPANSWIFSDTLNSSHIYAISPHCPFHYCLPYSSNLLLTTPDMQCQYKRSGILCGHCEEGLSTVFGSSQCKQCSSLYLFIVVPIAIAGVLMVMALFIFNITVNNGSYNTFILYVNMISINYSTFCPNSHSDCTILSLFNLDLGIETCFYNGMDDYSKIWFQLTFPFYLILIATVLIIASRYST